MNRQVIKYIVNFIVLILLQIIVLNNAVLFNIIHPYIYILATLLLPVHYSRLLVMLLAFLLGFIIDVYSSSYGMHTISTLTIGFLRPFLLIGFIFDESGEAQIEPHFQTLGTRRFLLYILILVFIHHFILFCVEAFSFSGFFHTLLKILINTLSTALIIFVYELLIFFRR